MYRPMFFEKWPHLHNLDLLAFESSVNLLISLGPYFPFHNAKTHNDL